MWCLYFVCSFSYQISLATLADKHSSKNVNREAVNIGNARLSNISEMKISLFMKITQETWLQACNEDRSVYNDDDNDDDNETYGSTGKK